jgi:hypothetical protein
MSGYRHIPDSRGPIAANSGPMRDATTSSDRVRLGALRQDCRAGL